MTSEHTLWSTIRHLREQREELKQEKRYLWALVCLLLFFWLAHYGMVHGGGI